MSNKRKSVLAKIYNSIERCVNKWVGPIQHRYLYSKFDVCIGPRKYWIVLIWYTKYLFSYKQQYRTYFSNAYTILGNFVTCYFHVIIKYAYVQSVVRLCPTSRALSAVVNPSQNTNWSGVICIFAIQLGCLFCLLWLEAGKSCLCTL